MDLEAAVQQAAEKDIPHYKSLDGVVFDASTKSFFIRREDDNTWTAVTESVVRTTLSQRGFSAKRGAGGGASKVDEAVADLQIKYPVVYSGELAGHGAGILQTAESGPMLVVRGPRLVQPVPGEWPTIKAFLNKLFNNELALSHFYGWLKVALEARSAGAIIPGQACVFAGPAGCGKSLLQQRIITPLLGGRACKPMQYLTKQTAFNKDLVRAEHWMMEDEHASIDVRARREFGTSIKEVTVNQLHRMHAKGKDAFVSVPLFVRLTISLNDEPENLMVLPVLDDSVRDKINLFKVENGFTFDIRDPEKRIAFERALAAEIPHFAEFLIREWKIEADMQDTRFGVKAYANPDILAVFEEFAPETQLLELLNRYYFAGTAPTEVHATSSEIQNSLVAAESVVSYEARRLLYHTNTCGIYLARLAINRPDRVVRRYRDKTKGVKWSIYPPRG